MWTIPDHSRGRARVCLGPCERFSGSCWVRSVSLEDDGEGLEFVLLSLAVAAVVAVAGAAVSGAVLGALSICALPSLLACLARRLQSMIKLNSQNKQTY